MKGHQSSGARAENEDKKDERRSFSADSFDESRVDGDLLLQLDEAMLRDDIDMKNGILRRR